MFVDFNVRYHLHQQMDTNFGRFKILALRTMAGDEVKDDVNNATLSFKVVRYVTFSNCQNWRSIFFL